MNGGLLNCSMAETNFFNHQANEISYISPFISKISVQVGMKISTSNCKTVKLRVWDLIGFRVSTRESFALQFAFSALTLLWGNTAHRAVYMHMHLNLILHPVSDGLYSNKGKQQCVLHVCVASGRQHASRHHETFTNTRMNNTLLILQQHK